MSLTDFSLVAVAERGNGHRGVYAEIFIPAETVIGLFDGKAERFAVGADGKVDYRGHDSAMIMHIIADADFVYGLVPLPGDIAGIDFINHSCHPNCRVVGGLALVAARDIQPGEELFYDYRSIETHPESVMCWCNKPEAERCQI